MTYVSIPNFGDRSLPTTCSTARQDKKIGLTSLAHLITPEYLLETWGLMNRKGASGIDGETMAQFEANLKERTEDLWSRLRQIATRLHL
ncbi:hypothetical protein PAENIP36_08650 [Paenibacillus sp. P36]